MASASAVPQNQIQTPQAAPAQPDESNQSAAPDETDASTMPDDSGEPVRLQRAFSALNTAICALFDGCGVPRTFTVPYIDQQETSEHVQSVGAAASQSGGLTASLLTSSHHANGRGNGYGDGHTVGHLAEHLRTTIIPNKNELAKAAISAAKNFLSKVASIIGEDKTITIAKSQLSMISKTDGAGMSCLDFGVALLQLVSPVIAAVARAHDQTKVGGMHPKLRGPRVAQQPQEDQE